MPPVVINHLTQNATFSALAKRCSCFSQVWRESKLLNGLLTYLWDYRCTSCASHKWIKVKYFCFRCLVYCEYCRWDLDLFTRSGLSFSEWQVKSYSFGDINLANILSWKMKQT